MTETVFYIAVGDQTLGHCGFTWRLWSRKTSFYLEAWSPGVKGFRISLHGDDPRHPTGGGFKAQLARVPDNTRLLHAFGQWPYWFRGVQVTDCVRHVVRIRWTWDVCHRLERVAGPTKFKSGYEGALIPPPPKPGDAVDVDLFISTGAPYWPREQKARRNNAVIGPFVDASGQTLTGIVTKHLAFKYPPPPNSVGPEPQGPKDELRALGSGVDHNGLLWIVEQRMSRIHLTELALGEDATH